MPLRAQAAHQEVNASKAAHKAGANTAASGAVESAGSALGHAVGWLGAKLDPTTRHTYKQVTAQAAEPLDRRLDLRAVNLSS